MFWGLIMEPKRRYTQVVKHPFHISMAALDIFSADDEPTQLMLFFEERNYLLCTLQKNNTVQCALDLNFEVGDEVVFATNGNCNIHLSGYLQDNLDDFDEMGEEEQDDEEVEEVKKLAQKKKKNLASNEKQPPLKKSKFASLMLEEYDSNDEDDESFVISETGTIDSDDVEEEEEDEDDDEAEEEGEEENESDEEKVFVESPKPKMNGVKTKKGKNETETVQKKEKPAKSKNKSPKQEIAPKQSPQAKRTLEGGVVIHDLNVGDGTIAKPGKVVQVYYEGRLKSNNKLFDQTTKGSGFKFRLGKQEVIKAWDVGVVGMKVGGRRRIVCPPAMAYGQKGSPPAIPPNSTLVFEVELKNVT